MTKRRNDGANKKALVAQAKTQCSLTTVMTVSFELCTSRLLHPSALPPWHGSSLAPFVCGGAQRGISLATGFFTGESRRKPLGARSGKKRLVIKGLRNHDLGALDSFAESGESSFRKPPCRKPASGSHLSEVIESARIFRLTQLPLLTYPLIIEE